jgi:hypothetical protein
MLFQKSRSKQPIEIFAEKNCIPASRETDGTIVIEGEAGCHLYEYSDSEFGLMILSDGKNIAARRWTVLLKKCLKAGMTLRQNGDDEGSVSFNPSNLQQARLAIRLIGIRPKRSVSCCQTLLICPSDRP